MVGRHHQLNGHEFEQAPGEREGQGSLTWYSPWGCKESDKTEQLDNNKDNSTKILTQITSQASLFSQMKPITAPSG